MRYILNSLLSDGQIAVKTMDSSRTTILSLDDSRVVIHSSVGPTLKHLNLVSFPALSPIDPYPGAILTVTKGVWSGSGPISFSYKWFREGMTTEQIAGANSDAYVVKNEDIGSTIYVEVWAKNPLGESWGESNYTNEIIPATSPTNLTLPIIAGTVAVGQYVHITSVGTWSATPAPSYTYQWFINSQPIAGKTGSSLLIESGMENGTIRAFVYASNFVGTTAALSNALSSVSLPVNITPPSVSGSIVEGDVLAANVGVWEGTTPITYTYQWFRYDGATNTDIPGETAATYTTVSADIAKRLGVRVTATNPIGTTSLDSSTVGPITPAGSLPVNTSAPVISGTVALGRPLTATPGVWTGTPTPTLAYQWYRGSTAISGATGGTYTVQGEDIAHEVTVRVTATNTAGSASATSNSLANVWQPLLAIKPDAIIFDGLDRSCFNNASEGDPVSYLYSINGLEIAHQSVTSKMGTRQATGLTFDGVDDEYLGSNALLNYHAGNATYANCLTTNTGSTNRYFLHAYEASGTNGARTALAANSASTARHFWRHRSASVNVSVTPPVAVTQQYAVTFTMGTPGSVSTFDMSTAVAPGVTTTGNMSQLTSLSGWKLGGERDALGYFTGTIRAWVFDNTVWTEAQMAVFRSCAVAAGAIA